MSLAHNNTHCKHMYHSECPYCALEKAIKFIESIMPQMKNIACDIGLLNTLLIESDKILKDQEG